MVGFIGFIVGDNVIDLVYYIQNIAFVIVIPYF
jgi:hypothetical protein